MMRILAALAIVLPASAQAQVACTTHEAMLGELALKFKEAPRGRGITMSGVLLEITMAPDGSTWSVLMTSANGLTCLMTAGKDWQAIVPAPTGRAM